MEAFGSWFASYHVEVRLPAVASLSASAIYIAAMDSFNNPTCNSFYNSCWYNSHASNNLHTTIINMKAAILSGHLEVVTGTPTLCCLMRYPKNASNCYRPDSLLSPDQMLDPRKDETKRRGFAHVFGSRYESGNKVLAPGTFEEACCCCKPSFLGTSVL